MSYKIYRANETSKVESYLISVFDGTGSMYHEYESAIDAYFEVFSDKRRGIKEFQFQFQKDQVYDLLPFVGINKKTGSITKAFSSVFIQVLQNKEKLPKYLTILFIGDGNESFHLHKLMDQIEEMKKNFSISFISLAVGNHFPLEISNNLRQELHNQDPNIQSTFVVERNRKKPQNEEGKLTLKQKVKQTIVSESSNQVIPNSVFYTENLEVVEYENGKKLEPSQKEDDIAQLITSSTQEALIKQKDQNFVETIKLIKQKAEVIIQNTPILQKEVINQQNSKLFEVLELVDDISDGNLQIVALTEDQKTKIQEAVLSDKRSLREEIVKYVEVVKNQKDLNEKTLNSRASEKLRQIKQGCYVKGRKVQELSKLEQAEIVLKDTLNNCVSIMEFDQQVDYVKLLTEFKNQTFISLNKVFKESDFKVETQEQINMLKQMNNLFELIHKVTIKQVNPKDFISTIKATKKNQQFQGDSQSIATSAAIFNSNEDFNYLPQELRLLVKEEIDLEEAEKVFVLLVDCNQSMEKESNMAIERFKMLFKNVPGDKKLTITWQDKKYLIQKEQDQQQQEIGQGNKFNTLFQCLQSVEKDYDLKNRRLFLCLVSDGETEYQTLHSEFKVAKFHYSIQFIYLAVGRKLFAKIENELRQKFANKNVKGAPELLNIPRQLNVSTSNNQKIGDQFSQKYEQLVKKMVG